MEFLGRLLRSLFILALSFGVVIGIASFSAPKGMSLRDMPRLMVDYRKGTTNPLAIKVLDLLMTDEQRQLALVGSAVQNSNTGQLQGAASIGEQIVLNGSENVVTGAGPVYDPRTFETINKMNIPEDLKRELWANYLRTGELPGSSLNPPAGSKTPPATAPSVATPENGVSTAALAQADLNTTSQASLAGDAQLASTSAPPTSPSMAHSMTQSLAKVAAATQGIAQETGAIPQQQPTFEASTGLPTASPNRAPASQAEKSGLKARLQAVVDSLQSPTH